MSGPSGGNQKPIQSKNDLVDFFAQGCSSKDDLKIGMESEKPPFEKGSNTPVTYDGNGGTASIRNFFDVMAARNGWTPGTVEAGKVIDLVKGKVNWTLEPAMQMETGDAPWSNVHDVSTSTDTVIQEAAQVADALGFRMVATGFHPTHRADTLTLMEKSRYQVYADHTSRNGIQNGMDLIACTSTVQANLGFTSERDFVEKIRVSISAAPAVIAMFATSPFADGKPSGYESYRGHVLHNGWNGRVGFMLPVAFENGFGFERYTDFVLEKMGMLGFYEGHTFKSAHLSKFGAFMEGKLEVCEGRKANLGDWSDLLNTVWPETRPRKFLEMRSADVGPPEMIKALAAFWTGLLYDDTSLRDAGRMMKDWTNAEREEMRANAPRTGLQTPFRNTTLQEICKELLDISRAGLVRRGIVNAHGRDESIYLEPLQQIVESGQNWSQRLLERYNGVWKGDISHLFKEMDFGASPSVLTAAAPKPSTRRIIALKQR